MTMRRILVCMLAVGLAATSVRTAAGAGFTDPKCASAKQKAAGKKEAAKLGCHAKATRKGVAVDSQCLAKAEARFASTFSSAETPVSMRARWSNSAP